MADRAYLERLTRELTDRGKLIEAGWTGFRLLVMTPDATKEQIIVARLAFFAGAQHLFGSMMGILEEDREPTEKDLERMDLINKELGDFAKELELRLSKTEGSA